MNTSLMAMSVALVLVGGFLVTLAVASLVTGGGYFLLGKPKLRFLKSAHGSEGFAFSFTWNAAREPARYDTVKIRLFNPFGTPTQVDATTQFEVQNDNFALDIFLGSALERILSAKGLERSLVQVEISSSKDGIHSSFDFKGEKFIKLYRAGIGEATAIDAALRPAKEAPLYTSTERTFISAPLPKTGMYLKIATNPLFAGAVGGADAGGDASGGGAAAVNFSVAKVWIEPGCIVCDACEGIYPEVFEVLDTTCIVRPNYPKENGLLVEEAAEACPVEVIKFDRVG